VLTADVAQVLGKRRASRGACDIDTRAGNG
jgi:hypothetical protein